MALHRNAQTPIERKAVMNLFENELTFLDDRTRTRGNHTKCLTLIRNIALLHQHQYQRPAHTVEHRRGKGLVCYIEDDAREIDLRPRLRTRCRNGASSRTVGEAVAALLILLRISRRLSSDKCEITNRARSSRSTY